MKAIRLFFISLCLATAVGCTPKDETEKKVDELLLQMTLHEKVGQMNLLSGGEWLVEAVNKGEVGSIINCSNPSEINRLQKAAVEGSRLGIPILFGRDVIHGFKTIFPIPLGLASTFNPEIVEKLARASAVEATATGIRWTFSPMLDIARDPRWGRIAEGSGEDPYLNTLMGLAMVRGYQGTGDSTSMAACIKHFVGYGAAEGGRDYNTTDIPERTMRNVYLPAFKAAVEEGAMTLMTSFNANDGVPSTGNKLLLQDILRNEWNFDGMVVTDWNSAGEMVAHGFAKDLKDATEKAANAGVDMDMMSYGYISFIEELVKEGKISEKQVDEAVRNILRLKFKLGLFEHPYVDLNTSSSAFYAPQHLAVAKQAAVESVVLLKNDNNALPLKGIKNILVTGPMADAAYDQLGTWAFDGEPEHTITPLRALKKEFNVVYVPGTEYSRDKSTAGIAAAKAAAARVDAAIVFVGEEAILSGEAHSLSNLNLQGAQSELIKAVRQSAKKLIVVVMAGRPLTIARDLENCDAMLYSFHPGTMGGEALADLLTGREVPSGKTPSTFLVDVGQAPFYYNHFNTGRPNNGLETLLDDIPLRAGQTSLGCTSYYLDSGYGPLFPFGYGLSYTKFKYENISLDKSSYSDGDTIKVTFTLKNTGDYAATEVAQLYVRDLVGSIARPVKELKHFARISLAAGEARNLKFELPVSHLAFWNADSEYKVEAGDFQLWVAGDSATGNPLSFTVE